MRLIFSSDQHCRPDRPICRVETDEEWQEFQEARIEEVVALTHKYKADLVLGGDLYDVPNVPSKITSMLIYHLANAYGNVHFIAANHELPWHRFDNISTSSIGILKAIAGDNTEKIRLYTPKEQLIEGRFQHSHEELPDIAVIHTLSFPTEDDVPFNAKATTAQALCEEYAQTYLLVGDNHTTFHATVGNQHVFSSGCLTAQNVNEKDHKRGVWFIDTDTGEFEFIEVSHDPSKVSADHITRKREKQAEIESVLEAIKSGKMDVSLDYVKNLFYYVEHNKVKQEVIAILDEIKEGVE